MPLPKPSLQRLRRPGQEPSSSSNFPTSTSSSFSKMITESTELNNNRFCRINSSPSHTKPLSKVGQHCYPFFRDHLHNPYPTLQEKEVIVSEANHPDVTLLSVSNWFANSRRRSGWIELCNEYYNGDTKRMVELCTHIICARGKTRKSDPSDIVEKVLDMESKVRAWHEERTEPSDWALALYDLITEFTSKLQTGLIDSVPEMKEDTYSCFATPNEQHDLELRRYPGLRIKRTWTDFSSDRSDSPELSRSPSFSSISSISTLPSESLPHECSNDGEDRATKRARFLAEEERLEDEPLALTDSTLQRKRCFTEFSDSESFDLRLPRKRPRTTDGIPETEICHLNELSCEPTSQNTLPFLSTVPSAADLQSPDENWNLDVSVYDWSSFSDLHLLVAPDAPSFQTDAQSLNLPEVIEAKDNTIGNTVDWLQIFFPNDSLGIEPEKSSSHTPTTDHIPDQGETLIRDYTLVHEGDLTGQKNDAESYFHTLEDIQLICPGASDTNELPSACDYPSEPFSGLDSFPLDFPQAFLLDYCTT